MKIPHIVCGKNKRKEEKEMKNTSALTFDYVRQICGIILITVFTCCLATYADQDGQHSWGVSIEAFNGALAYGINPSIGKYLRMHHIMLGPIIGYDHTHRENGLGASIQYRLYPTPPGKFIRFYFAYRFAYFASNYHHSQYDISNSDFCNHFGYGFLVRFRKFYLAQDIGLGLALRTNRTEFMEPGVEDYSRKIRQPSLLIKGGIGYDF